MQLTILQLSKGKGEPVSGFFTACTMWPAKRAHTNSAHNPHERFEESNLDCKVIM